jgi:hypothetical protein
MPAALLLDQVAARQHDVAALLVDLEHLALDRLAQEIVEVAHRHHVDLRTRQEGVHAHIHQQAALDLALDHARHHRAFFARSQHVVPVALLFRARLAQHHHSVFVFEALQQHFDFVAHVQFSQILELGRRQQAFRLVSDVDQHFLRTDLDDLSLDDRAFGEGLEGFFVHRHHLGALGVHFDDRLLRCFLSHMTLERLMTPGFLFSRFAAENPLKRRRTGVPFRNCSGTLERRIPPHPAPAHKPKTQIFLEK